MTHGFGLAEGKKPLGYARTQTLTESANVLISLEAYPQRVLTHSKAVHSRRHRFGDPRS